MNAEQLAMRISAKYPNYFTKMETRAVWETDYRHAFAGLDDDQIEAAYHRVMKKWDNHWPPYPKEFVAAAPKKKLADGGPLYSLTELHDYADAHWSSIADQFYALNISQVREIEKDERLRYRFRRTVQCCAKRIAQHDFLSERGRNVRRLDLCKAEDREYLSESYGDCDAGGDFFVNYLRLALGEVPESESASSPPSPEDIPDKFQE